SPVSSVLGFYGLVGDFAHPTFPARMGGGERKAVPPPHPCFWSVASVGPALGPGGRRETSAPASRGIIANTSELVAEIRAMMIHAGWKSAAVMLSWPRQRSVASTSAAPTATPIEIDSCWPTATSEVARLMRARSISA